MSCDRDPLSGLQTIGVNYCVNDVYDPPTSCGRHGDDLRTTSTGRGTSATCDDVTMTTNAWRLRLWNDEVLKAAQ